MADDRCRGCCSFRGAVRAGNDIRSDGAARSGSTVRTNDQCADSRAERRCGTTATARSTTPRRGPTTTGNAPRANATTRQSSPWPAGGPTSCSRCCVTAPSTKTPPTLRPRHQWPWLLDENHRGTPPACADHVSPDDARNRKSRASHTPVAVWHDRVRRYVLASPGRGTRVTRAQRPRPTRRRCSTTSTILLTAMTPSHEAASSL